MSATLPSSRPIVRECTTQRRVGQKELSGAWEHPRGRVAVTSSLGRNRSAARLESPLVRNLVDDAVRGCLSRSLGPGSLVLREPRSRGCGSRCVVNAFLGVPVGASSSNR